MWSEVTPTRVVDNRRDVFLMPMNMRTTSSFVMIREKAISVQRLGVVRVAILRDEICDEGVQDPETFVAELQRLQIADIFNFRQQLPHTEPLFSYPFEWDNLAVLHITTYENWWNNQIYNDARRMVRKAEKKGITARVVPLSDELVWGIKSLWDETRIKQGRPNRHYGKSFEDVKRLNSTFPDRAQFIGAFYGDELVGINKVFYTGSRADIIHFMAKIAHRDKAPANLLLAKGIALAADRGVPFMTYAGFSYGKKGEDSLTDFKERNGFKRVDIPRYFVPLTRRGSVALKIGLHKGIKEALPGPLLRGASKLRMMAEKCITAYSRGRVATKHL